MLKRKWPFPIMFMIVEDCLPDSLGKNRGSAEAKQLLFPWFKKEIKMAYTIDSVPRGDHRLAKIRVRTGDPLGLLERECEIQLEASFLVLPSYQEIAYRASGGSYDEHAGRVSELRRKDSTLASGIREYQPGDRFAWVDWKTSARRSQLMTKEFEQTKGDDLLVFMDQSRLRLLKRSSRLPLPSFVRQCGAGRMQGLFPLVRSGMSSRFGRGRAAEKAVLLLGDCRLQCSPAVSQSDRGGIGTFRYEKSRQIYCDKPHHDRTGAGFEETALRRAARHLFGEEKRRRSIKRGKRGCPAFKSAGNRSKRHLRGTFFPGFG